MTIDEFYSLTPRMIDSLLLYRPREERDLEMMLAQLTHAAVNRSFRAPREPIPVAAFLLQRGPTEGALGENADTKRQQVLGRLATFLDGQVVE